MELHDKITQAVDADTDLAALFEQAHHAKRRAQKQRHQAAQPKIGAAGDFAVFLAEMRRPLTEAERTHNGLDYLCVDVRECAETGEFVKGFLILVATRVSKRRSRGGPDALRRRGHDAAWPSRPAEDG